jgi:hypothetical protein
MGVVLEKPEDSEQRKYAHQLYMRNSLMKVMACIWYDDFNEVKNYLKSSGELILKSFSHRADP